jgi:hypothetical protein
VDKYSNINSDPDPHPFVYMIPGFLIWATIYCLISIFSFISGNLLGLLGNYNGDPNDDFVSRNGTVLASTSSMKTIHFDFGLTCKYFSSFTDYWQKVKENV